MLEKILNFIIPGPLDERFGFGARVFCSWISLGLGLGLGLGFVNVLGLGSALSWENVVESLIGGCIGGIFLSCGYGLIGVVIDSIRGRRVEYPGWYWWIFPIATFLSILLWMTFGLFGVFLAFAGIKLPKLPDFGHMPESSGYDTKEAIAKEISEDYDLIWTKDAQAELNKIPGFVRGQVKRNIEKFARDRGFDQITVEVMYAAKVSMRA